MIVKKCFLGILCIGAAACTTTPGLQYTLNASNYSDTSLILAISSTNNPNCMYSVNPTTFVLTPASQSVQMVTNNEGSSLEGGCENNTTDSLQYFDIIKQDGSVLASIKLGMNSVDKTCVNYVVESIDSNYSITATQKNSDSGYNTSDVYVNICNSGDTACGNNAVNNAPKC